MNLKPVVSTTELREGRHRALHSRPMNLEFTGPIWYWKGPAPFYFVTVPDEECLESGGGVFDRELWLGHDPGHGSDRPNRVENVALAQGWPVHRADEDGSAQGRRDAS